MGEQLACRRLLNGLIIQFANNLTANQTVTFPIVFSTIPAVVFTRGGGVYTDTNNYVTNISKSSVYIGCPNTSQGGGCIIAIGY